MSCGLDLRKRVLEFVDKLVNRLADIFPESSHVQFHSLAEKTDTEIWEFAKLNDFCIITQDADFPERSWLYGS
jgi:predicted nuclease of predicted toxin-antitoxin system